MKKSKVLLITASSVCLVASTAAIAAQTTVVQQPGKKTTATTVQKTPQAVTSPQKKTIYQPADADIQSPTMMDPGPRKHLGAFINMGPESRIQINGFLSAGISGSTATPVSPYVNDAATGGAASYNRGYVIPERGLVSNKVGFAANSLVGLQFTGNITSSLAAVAQFVSSGSELDGNDAYDIQTQWAFVRYRPNNQWQLRAGRMRIPLFAYSDTQEIAYTYPWVFLPNTVYRIVPFNNFNGADIVFSQPLGDSDWLLSIHPFYGANDSKFNTITQGFVGTTRPAGSGTCNSAAGSNSNCAPVLLQFNENGIIGAELTIGSDQIQVRGSYAHASLDGSASSPYGYNIQTLSGDNAYFYSVGLKLAFDWFHFQSEFASRHAQQASGGDGSVANLNGYYGMVGGQFGRWFPNVTYGRLTTTNRATLLTANALSGTLNTNEAPQAEEDWTLGVAYTVNGNVVVKANATRVRTLDGTWGLFNYNPGTGSNWLFSGSVDVIF
jgi:hypothetical protein